MKNLTRTEIARFDEVSHYIDKLKPQGETLEAFEELENTISILLYEIDKTREENKLNND